MLKINSHRMRCRCDRWYWQFQRRKARTPKGRLQSFRSGQLRKARSATRRKLNTKQSVYFISDDYMARVQQVFANSLFMKKEDEKVTELIKLKQLAPFPIDTSFITGYLAFGVPAEFVNQVKDLVQQIIIMVYEQLITSQNMLQLLIMLKFDLLSGKHLEQKKTLQSLIEPYLTELALDNSYLSKRYFQREINREDIVPESMGIQCSVCLVDIMSSDLCLLSCGHMFHRNCLSEYSKEKIINKLIPFSCPQEGCKAEITGEEVGEFLPKDLKEKYDDFAFHNYVDAHMDDTSWCPTPGCSAVFTFDAALTDYRCPACKKHYCLACKCEFHTNFTCAQYKEMSNLEDDDKKFMMLAKGAKYKQCPSCKFWVEKNEGCDHMTCRCKYQFCYVCGGKYGRCKCQGYEDQVIIPIPPPPIPHIQPVLPPIPHIEPVPPIARIEPVRPRPHIEPPPRVGREFILPPPPFSRPVGFIRPPPGAVLNRQYDSSSNEEEEMERVINLSKVEADKERERAVHLQVRSAISRIEQERKQTEERRRVEMERLMRLEEKKKEEARLFEMIKEEEVRERIKMEEKQNERKRQMQQRQKQRKRQKEQQSENLKKRQQQFQRERIKKAEEMVELQKRRKQEQLEKMELIKRKEMMNAKIEEDVRQRKILEEEEKKKKEEFRRKEEQNKRNEERQSRLQKIKEAEQLRLKLQKQRERMQGRIKDRDSPNSSKEYLQFGKQPITKIKLEEEPSQKPSIKLQPNLEGRSMILLSSVEEKKEPSLESMIKNYSASVNIEERRQPYVLSLVDKSSDDEAEKKQVSGFQRFPKLSFK